MDVLIAVPSGVPIVTELLLHWRVPNQVSRIPGPHAIFCRAKNTRGAMDTW